MLKRKILPVTIVRCGGRWEVRLAGRLIRIRTRAGSWIEAGFEAREAAEAYRWFLIGSEFTSDQPLASYCRNREPVARKKAR